MTSEAWLKLQFYLVSILDDFRAVEGSLFSNAGGANQQLFPQTPQTALMVSWEPLGFRPTVHVIAPKPMD